MLDERARLLLKALVERYIADGQPVGSRTLSKASGLDLSPATIRNVMSDLEDLGLIVSPHTSAGRIPTARGYRLFVDTMLTMQRDQYSSLSALGTPRLAPDQPQKVFSNAANILSDLSQFVGVVMAPRRTSVFRHIEFLRLSEKRILVIIVSPDGDVQNRVIFTETDYTQSQLIEAANFLNSHYAGMAIEDAAVLAYMLGRYLDDPADALRGYEGARRLRTARAQQASRRQARIYGMTGPEALVRNLAMRAMGGEKLRARQDWLYTWQPPERSESV